MKPIEFNPEHNAQASRGKDVVISDFSQCLSGLPGDLGKGNKHGPARPRKPLVRSKTFGSVNSADGRKKLIYVVDDETALSGMLGMILSKSNEAWTVQDFDSPLHALEAARRAPPHLVISDLCMPGMSGSQMLDEIRDLAPQAIRILYSGYANPKQLSRISVAHQYLAKPLSFRELQTKVEQALAAQEALASPQLRELLTSLRSLPTLPHNFHSLLNELDDPNGSHAKAAQFISADAGITTKMLQIANSAMFGGSAISHPLAAVLHLGTDTVKAIVLSLQLFAAYEKSTIFTVDLSKIWRHSWHTAHLARRLCQAEGCSNQIAHEAFLAGIVHDVGKLILMDNYPKRYDEARRQALAQSRPLSEVEREVFHINHTEITAFLLCLWGMSEGTIEAVRCHNEPFCTKQIGFGPAAALYVANHLARKIRPPDPFVIPDLNTDYLDSIGCRERVKEWKELAQWASQEAWQL